MSNDFAEKLRKRLHDDRKRYETYLLSGSIADHTHYKVVCAKLEELNRLLVLVDEAIHTQNRMEGLTDD